MKKPIKKLLSLATIMLLLSIISIAQQKHTISGHVTDAATGEELLGSSVVIKATSTGTVTNGYGFYSLTMEQGNYEVIYSFIGYQSVTKKIELSKNQVINIELGENTENLAEVEVLGQKVDKNVRSTDMGVLKLNPKEIATLPVLFGEQDVLKTIQLMPGVKAAGEGGSGFHVRGGSADQNLILIDESPVYNASHLMGFFSVFNSDALKDVTMIKGGMPAEYGGRLSSVLDIKMKDGNMKDFGASGGIGLISSRLTLEGPIKENDGSFVISGRRTYADLFLAFSSEEQLQNTSLYFYDLNMKANYKIGGRDRIYLSGYFGRDVFGFNDEMGMDWGNATGTIRWNHLFTEKLFSNTTLLYSKYDYQMNMSFGDNSIDILSGIEDFNLKEDFTWFINSKSKLKFGANAIYHTFIPGKVEVSNITNAIDIGNDYGLESAAYISLDQDLGDRWKINAGLRYSNFTALGEGSVYTYDADDNIADSTYYGKNEVIKNYGGLEPRLSATYLINEKSSFKLAYNRNRQYLHLVSNSSSGTPMDAWIPSSALVEPGIADQVAVGYFRNFLNNTIETSAEIYYKDMQNQVDYKNGADLMLNPYVESQLIFGDGRAYGLELYARKKTGKLTGWISYTLSRTERTFEDVGDYWYPLKHDRTHDISIVGMYQINKKWSASASWVYNTGDAYTTPSGKYEIGEVTYNAYSDRNEARMPDYHRLDLGLTYWRTKTNKREASWNFSVYNAYARENAYTITFAENEETGVPEATQLSLFSIIPSISYNFKF